MRSNLVTISIPNWEKYNPRSDRTPSWFRFQNNFYNDDKLYDLTGDERHVLIMVFCAASESGKPEVVISLSKISVLLKTSIDFVAASLQKLSDELNLIVITNGSNPLPTRYQTGRNGSTTNERTNERTGRNETNERTDEHIAPSNKLPEADAPLPVELSAAHGFLIDRKAKAALVRVWLETFTEPDWIVDELKKAHAWEVANPRKKKKDFGKFMTNWLNRGWDARKIPSNNNRAEQRTTNNRAAGEAYMKKLEGEKV